MKSKSALPTLPAILIILTVFLTFLPPVLAEEHEPPQEAIPGEKVISAGYVLISAAPDAFGAGLQIQFTPVGDYPDIVCPNPSGGEVKNVWILKEDHPHFDLNYGNLQWAFGHGPDGIGYYTTLVGKACAYNDGTWNVIDRVKVAAYSAIGTAPVAGQEPHAHSQNWK